MARRAVPWLTLAWMLAGASAVAGQGVPPAFPDSVAGARYASLRGERATLYFAAADSLVAERVRALIDAQPPLPGLPSTLPADVTAVLAHSPRAFDELTGGVVPEWRAGVAIPSRNLLVIPIGEGPRILDAEGRRTLRHEWAHLGLHGYLGDLRVPRWFDEGYAQWASGGFDATEAWRLRLLIALGRAPRMDSLALAWPAGREQARSAYLLAASAVTYLLSESGERGLTLFLERWRGSGSFEDALRGTFGVTSGQLEEDWRQHVKDRYGWLSVLGHSTIFWLLMGTVLIFMARVRRVHNREKLAQLRAGELPDEPAFWMPDEATGTADRPPAGEGGPSGPASGASGPPTRPPSGGPSGPAPGAPTGPPSVPAPGAPTGPPSVSAPGAPTGPPSGPAPGAPTAPPSRPPSGPAPGDEPPG